jgi:hypothetical protein
MVQTKAHADEIKWKRKEVKRSTFIIQLPG